MKLVLANYYFKKIQLKRTYIKVFVCVVLNVFSCHRPSVASVALLAPMFIIEDLKLHYSDINEGMSACHGCLAHLALSFIIEDCLV